ncbi:hypothetical protein CEUSTIGMA_g2000.t1 [Chlamydomonas eustigma]|uniref:Uncharacterized protein n=1 Tax=Chlamydomonas eustigma TaxID=1157962 RepID=A0A250WVJ2_9CHLO|nr:hypothetical protein CEUSTIGMA_g2000.t1 [Chlamydomonas eustigma]|eukprot:GAX74550.1 hypothetical protein CEUSTIGMA_g2000.t1 [Chlamydomonas eustigma]
MSSDDTYIGSHGRGMPPTSMGMKGPGIVNIDFKDPEEHAPEVPLWYENSRKQARLMHSQADASDSHNGQQRKQQLHPLTDLPGQQYIYTRVKNYTDNNLPELSQLAPSAPFVPAAVKLSASPQKQCETAFGAINGSPQRPRGLCKGLASARPSSWSFEGSPGKPPWVNAGNRVTQSQEPVSLFVPSRPVRQLPPMPIRELSESPAPHQSLQQAPKTRLPQHLAKLPKLGHPIGQAAALPKPKEYAAPFSRKVMLPGLRQYPGGSLGLPLVDGSGFSGPTFVPPPHVDTDSSGISEREMLLIPQVESIS